jgi:expansin (peptidoglycan-binding protein)
MQRPQKRWQLARQKRILDVLLGVLAFIILIVTSLLLTSFRTEAVDEDHPVSKAKAPMPVVFNEPIVLEETAVLTAVLTATLSYLPIITKTNNDPIPFGDLHSGEGTYYHATGAGNCTFPASPQDLMVAAMNHTDYANAALCGAFVQVHGPNGSVIVRIVDRCPHCPVGDVDLSQQAFAQIADLSAGRVPITWQLISPPLSDSIVYHFKDGSNQWWTAVQIRNHRNPITKFEYLDGNGNFQTVPRLDYNYFVQASGMGPGPYTFRVTDIFGNTVTDSGIPHTENGDVAGSSQFPPPP